jgi:uncharacterized protein (TIRG00374 family)
MISSRCLPSNEVVARPIPKHSFYWLIALPLAALFLYLAFRGVDGDRVWHVSTTADLPLLAAGWAATNLSYFVRAIRWRILLSAGQSIPLRTVFWSNSAGYLGNAFLPARAGEVLRSVMISARSNLTKTFALTTALAERAVDAVVLITVSSVVLLTVEQKPAWLAAASKTFAAVGLASLITLVLLPRAHGVLEALLQRFPLPETLRRALLHIAEQIVLGIRSLHHPVRLAGFCSLTVTVWILDAFTATLVARGLGLGLGFGVALLWLTSVGLGSALPSTPGSIGVYQFVTVTVLAPFGFSHSDALAYALITQGLNYLVVAFWGLIALWRYPATAQSAGQ